MIHMGVHFGIDCMQACVHISQITLLTYSLQQQIIEITHTLMRIPSNITTFKHALSLKSKFTIPYLL